MNELNDDGTKPTGVDAVWWDNLRGGWGMGCLCGHSVNSWSDELVDAAQEMEDHWRDDPLHIWPQR